MFSKIINLNNPNNSVAQYTTAQKIIVAQFKLHLY